MGPPRRSQHSCGWSTGACFPERRVRILHMALAATACTCQDCVQKATPLRLLGTTDDTEASPQRGQRHARAPQHQEESRHTTATAQDRKEGIESRSWSRGGRSRQVGGTGMTQGQKGWAGRGTCRGGAPGHHRVTRQPLRAHTWPGTA